MTRITFLGAGSAVFTRQLLVDILRYDDLPELEIALQDIDPDRLEIARGTAEHVAQRFGKPLKVTASLDRREMLEGATAVVIMVQVGGVEGTRKDLEIPARYGLRQTIGDTTGVGGVFRGLRTFPVISEIARDVRAVCPDAWVLNYTNPMTLNVWWWSVVAPEVKVVGLCHSVYWTANDLSELVGVPFDEVTYSAAGVNHQAWLTEWSRDGESLYPLLDAKLAADPELLRRVRVEMYRRIGYYPTETSEHSSEYLPWFLRSDEQVEKYRLEPLVYLDISHKNLAEVEQVRRQLAAGEPLDLPDEGAAEYAPQIIHSLLTGTERRIHVNVPNAGYIGNLPQGAVVEVPAVVDGDGVRPVAVGSIPTAGAALNRTMLSVAELTMQAAVDGDPRAVRQAVLVDGNASATLTPEQIWALCDELTEAHRAHLPRSLGGEVDLVLP